MTKLREILEVRQFPGEQKRRWFSSPTMDLFVWCSDLDVPVGFQFTYDKGKRERALTWKPDLGFAHDDVDDGENHESKYKSTPVLFGDGKPNLERILDLFLANNVHVPPEINAFLISKIGEYRIDVDSVQLAHPADAIWRR